MLFTFDYFQSFVFNLNMVTIKIVCHASLVLAIKTAAVCNRNAVISNVLSMAFTNSLASEQSREITFAAAPLCPYFRSKP